MSDFRRDSASLLPTAQWLGGLLRVVWLLSFVCSALGLYLTWSPILWSTQKPNPAAETMALVVTVGIVSGVLVLSMVCGMLATLLRIEDRLTEISRNQNRSV
jgi:hypothetical protein